MQLEDSSLNCNVFPLVGQFAKVPHNLACQVPCFSYDERVQMQLNSIILQLGIATLMVSLLTQCASLSGSGNMGGPTEEVRAAQIAAEPKGDFFYGRRYYVRKTRFWGYLRKPGQSARQSKLVIFRETNKLCPDRLPENGPPGQRYGFDQNYEYRIWGRYTGREVYDINSNQFLPEFLLTDYQLVNQQPGWLFRPTDYYNPTRVTLIPH
ncbi:MAG: hypothetical protein RL117_781 [Verrucomicrobiota bacterium]